MKRTLVGAVATACMLSCAQMAAAPGGADFTVAILPDTQYYTSAQYGGTNLMFTSQADWIVANRSLENIAYVIHLGDCTDHGDAVQAEWLNVTSAMYRLEPPNVSTHIPYGLAVGNHDQSPNQGNPLTSTTTYYNQFFGYSHFNGRSYYGGRYGTTNNDSHLGLFTAGGMDFMVAFVEYDSVNADWSGMHTWVNGRLAAYPNRKAIVVTHNMVQNDTNFSPQGANLYNTIKAKSNLFMMLGGHHAGNGEAQRVDTYDGKRVRSYLSDYQGRTNGGNGLMRTIKFSPVNDTYTVKTFRPYPDVNNPVYEADTDSQFTRAWRWHLNRICYFELGGKTDRSHFNGGIWKVEGQSNVTSGQSGDIPVPGDYDGDGDSDYVVWRPSNGQWLLNGVVLATYGQSGDIPVPGDYNGDGKNDFVVWRPSAGIWYAKDIATITYGDQPTDIPVPGDYDGDGRHDYAVWRPSTGQWFIYQQTPTITYGQNGDIPVPADYNGDGKTDRAVWRPSTQYWYRYNLGAGIKYGFAGEIPAPGDYDGNGTVELATYRPSNFSWYVHPSTTGVAFGGVGDKPLPLPYCISRVFFP